MTNPIRVLRTPWHVSFNTPSWKDFEGGGIYSTISYEATDNLSIKNLMEYHDWYWYGRCDGDQTASPLETIWEVPMEIYQYSGELQVIYGGPDTKFSFIGGLYYYMKHEVQGFD